MLQIGSCEVERPKKDLVRGFLIIHEPRATFNDLSIGDKIYSIKYELKKFYQQQFTVKAVSKDNVKVKNDALPYWPLMTVRRDDIKFYADERCVISKDPSLPIPKTWIANIDPT